MTIHAHLKLAKKLAELLEGRFQVFGVRFGLDALVGVVPDIGDLVTLIFSLYLIWIGIRIHVPRRTLVRMLFHAAVDTVIGTIPVIGDTFDVFYRANTKNLQLLEKYLPSYVEEGKVVS